MRRFLFGTAALAALCVLAMSPIGAASPDAAGVTQDKSPDVKAAKKPRPPPRRVVRRPPPPPPPYPPPGHGYYAGPPSPYWGYPYWRRPHWAYGYGPYYRPYYRPYVYAPFPFLGIRLGW